MSNKEREWFPDTSYHITIRGNRIATKTFHSVPDFGRTLEQGDDWKNKWGNILN